MSTTESTADTNRALEIIADHPRLLGALFLLMLIMGEAGQVAANTSSATAGP